MQHLTCPKCGNDDFDVVATVIERYYFWIQDNQVFPELMYTIPTDDDFSFMNCHKCEAECKFDGENILLLNKENVK